MHQRTCTHVKNILLLILLFPLSIYGQNEQIGVVIVVIDGDTIDVEIDGEVHRNRYIGVNTPERNEDCYDEASEANSLMIEGKSVRLVKDKSETDRYGRLLRYVYAGDTFVNLEHCQNRFLHIFYRLEQMSKIYCQKLIERKVP